MAELSARWVGGAARPGQAGLVLGSSGQSSARFVDKEHSLRWTRAELQVPLAHPPLGAGGSPGAEQHVWGHPSQERSDMPCSAPQRSHRGIENALFCSGGERGVLCPSRTNLRQSPQSPAREVSSFVFSLWCLTNRASFSGECIVAQLTPVLVPWEGGCWSGCSVACSHLSPAGWNYAHQPCPSGWWKRR